MRKSNFALGQNKYNDKLTTTQVDYQMPPAGYKAQSIDAKRKADLRNSHWTMGACG